MTASEEKIAVATLANNHTAKELASKWSSEHRSAAAYSLLAGLVALAFLVMLALNVRLWTIGAMPDVTGPAVRDALIDVMVIFTANVLIVVRIRQMKVRRRLVDLAIKLQRSQQGSGTSD